MKIFEYTFPNILMKFCEKEEYAKSIANGDIYMSMSGYFRKLEDNYRGDKYDGIKPLDMTGETITIGEVMLDNITDFTVGFENDDRIPMFCGTLLTEDILLKTSKTTLKFKDEFLKEIEQFGRYVVFIDLDEMLEKIKKIENDDNVNIDYRRVEYTDILNYYTENDVFNTNNRYLSFYVKDISYKWQNEFRLLYLSKSKIDTDFKIMRLGKLEKTQLSDIENLKDNEFVIYSS